MVPMDFSADLSTAPGPWPPWSVAMATADSADATVPRLVPVPGPEIQELMLAAAQCRGSDGNVKGNKPWVKHVGKWP